MSFNRLKYDTCAYQKNLEESMAPGCYQFYAGKYANNNNCRIEFGILGGNNVSVYKGNIVDLESDLRGQTRPNSQCPSNKFSPQCKQPCDSGLPSGQTNCNSDLVNLPTCNIICYKPVTYAPKPSVSFCPGLYETNGRGNVSKQLNEGFCLDSLSQNYDSYPKWTPVAGRPCPFSEQGNLPERCSRCSRCNRNYNMCTCGH